MKFKNIFLTLSIVATLHTAKAGYPNNIREWEISEQDYHNAQELSAKLYGYRQFYLSAAMVIQRNIETIPVSTNYKRIQEISKDIQAESLVLKAIGMRLQQSLNTQLQEKGKMLIEDADTWHKYGSELHRNPAAYDNMGKSMIQHAVKTSSHLDDCVEIIRNPMA